MERLDGKRIVITGGTSGMGQTMTEGFPGLGAKVVFWGRNEAAGKQIEQATGAKFMKIDISDEAQVNEGMKAAAEYLGGIDVLVNAAGVAPHKAAENITLAEWNEIFGINATGTFLTNKAVFPYMKESGGHIINFTSASAFIVSPGQAHYGASKGAVNVWSRTIAKDWMPYNIRVNLVAPCIWTPMYDKTRAALPPEQVAAMDMALKGMCLGGKLGDPVKDFLPVMAFLASDSSKYITGQTISVDGGVMMVR